jgi:hypothetical protein
MVVLVEVGSSTEWGYGRDNQWFGTVSERRWPDPLPFLPAPPSS